jgi:hypothetical protein
MLKVGAMAVKHVVVVKRKRSIAEVEHVEMRASGRSA